MIANSFKSLHSKNSFFVLGNCWDTLSARAYEQAGYKALGTSSWALSSINGVKDGENIDFNNVISHVKTILKTIKIPLSVDIEKGYSKSKETIVNNVLKLAHLGCAGINIEDSTHTGELLPPEKFSDIIDKIRSALIADGFPEFVITARTDVYLVRQITDKIKHTLLRESIYKDSGADCLFVPGLANVDEISTISKETTLPLNVLNLPGIGNVSVLQKAGVNRFSLGNSVFDDTLAYLERTIEQSTSSGNYAEHYNHVPLKLTF